MMKRFIINLFMFIIFFTFKVGTFLVITNKNQPTKKCHIRWLKTQILKYILCAEQVHSKLPFCFNNSLNSSRDWHSFKFAGKLFHKTLFLNFNEFITYFRVFASGARRVTLLLTEYGVFFSSYAFRLELGLSLFLHLYISMAKNCKCFWWIFNLLSTAKR